MSRVRQLLKPAVTTFNRVPATVRTRRAASSGVEKLILGASTTDHPGWLSTDISWRTRYYLDATKPWPIRPSSLTHVYADNVIEHVTLPGARAMLSGAFTALRPGGRIRIVTPDIEATARAYLTPGPERDAALARARDDDGTPAVYPVDVIRTVLTQAGHYLGQAWDMEAITAELGRAGFAQIERFSMTSTGDHAFSNMEAREVEVDGLTLAVEAVKS